MLASAGWHCFCCGSFLTHCAARCCRTALKFVLSTRCCPARSTPTHLGMAALYFISVNHITLTPVSRFPRNHDACLGAV